MRRYLIIGSGAAGIGAAEAIRTQDPQGSLTLVCEELAGYYSRPGLAYYLTGEVPENQLFPFSDRDFQRLNIQRVHGRAVQIHIRDHQVELDNRRRLPYERLLIATGAKAARTQAPGIEVEGVVKLDTLADAQAILRLARKARSAVVVGGGITALELVEGLSARGVKVHYFLRGDRYWGNVLDETESRLVENRLKEEGVQIHYHTELAEVLSKKGKLVGVRTKDGRELRAEILGVAIGVLARKELAEASGLKTERGILVDEFLQTSAPDVFAAGDVAQVWDPLAGKAVLDSLWGPAREQGTVAGLNMSQPFGGPCKPYYKLVPFNVTRLGSLTTTIIGALGTGRDEDTFGIVRGDSETWRELPDAIAAQGGFEVNRLRVLVGETTLVGALVMGDQTLSPPLQHLIARQVDITSIRDQLLSQDGRIADLLADFWAAYKRQPHAAQ